MSTFEENYACILCGKNTHTSIITLLAFLLRTDTQYFHAIQHSFAISYIVIKKYEEFCMQFDDNIC